jgi:hypothetical protein
MSSRLSHKSRVRKLIELSGQNSLGKQCDLLNICFQDKVIKNKTGYNDPTQSNYIRVSQLLNISTLGGRTTFGNPNINYITYLGGTEGQPGGLPTPPRNKF